MSVSDVPVRHGPGLMGLTLACAVALGAGAEGRPAPDAARSQASAHETIVRATYARLQEYARGSGRSVEFELSDFRTYEPAQFSELRWFELVSMPGGRMLDMMRSVRQNDATRTAGVTYEPSWSERDEAQVVGPGVDVTEATVAQVLETLAARSVEVRDAQALTSYAVTARLDGESRSYRGAFVWLRRSLTSYTFIVGDNVTQGVDPAARETLPAAGLHDYLQGLPGTPWYPEGPPGPGGGGQTCQASNSTTSTSYSDSSSAGHAWGSHSADVGFSISCTCNTSCTSSCYATITSSSCSDSGLPWGWCHNMQPGSNANADSKPGGSAACAAGFGCVEKECPFCQCTLGISVSILGAGVTFGASGSPDWQSTRSYSRTCGLCVPDDPPPPPPPPGGGGGGGGGGTPPGPTCGGLYDFDCGNNGSWDYISVCVGIGQNPVDVGCSLCFGSGLTPFDLDSSASATAPGSNMVATCFNVQGVTAGTGAGGGSSVGVRLVPVAPDVTAHPDETRQ